MPRKTFDITVEETPGERLLVIKLGSLGDFVQALGAMEAIRIHHPDADITLMTTAPYVTLGRACGYFDHIITDNRPKWNDIKGWLALRKKLNEGRFKRVYDLQNSDRTSLYLRLFHPRPEWVGAARGASHRNDSPERVKLTPFMGHKQTLAVAGINNVRIDQMAWVRGDSHLFDMKAQPFVLLVPGSSPHLPHKRWPARHYGEMAKRLFNWGFLPVIVGTQTEKDAAAAIRTICPEALDLTGLTTLTDLVILGRNAASAIGNDTGPLHMIAQTGCPTIALFSNHSNASRHAPLGDNVETIQVVDLSTLDVETVAAMVNLRGFRQQADAIVFTSRHEH
jgi:ADP-heptose:LPS heptosyltransferase